MSDRDQDYKNRTRPCECMHNWLLHRRRDDGSCAYWKWWKDDLLESAPVEGGE
jgi:hypothetical protein